MPAVPAARDERRPRTLRRAAVLSILIHLGGLLLFGLRAPGCDRPRDPIGSEELDVDLVAPRLAPPLRHQGPADRAGKGEGEREGDEARRARQGGSFAAASERLAATSGQPASPRAQAARATVPARSALAASPSRTVGSSPAAAPRGAKAAPRTPFADEVRAQASLAPAAPSPPTHPAATAPALAPSNEGELLAMSAAPSPAAPREPRRVRGRRVPARETPAEALLRLYREASLPEAPAPATVLAAVQAEIRERQDRELSLRREQRRRAEAAERRIAALDAQARRAGPVAGSGAGSAGGEGEAASSRGGRSGSCYGLRFYLSGRQVKASRVVKPPEAISLPPIRCRVDRIDITPATVRMLVDKAGSVGIAYLLHSSSSAHFDRCAVRHARSIRFRPGHDGGGTPLSVWINVRVEPSLLTAGL